MAGWVVGCLSVIWAEQRAEEAVVSVGRITVTVKLLPYCDKQTTTARTTTTARMAMRKRTTTVWTGSWETGNCEDEDERMGVSMVGWLGGWLGSVGWLAG